MSKIESTDFVKKINNTPEELRTDPQNTKYCSIVSHKDFVYLKYKQEFFYLQINGPISTKESEFSWVPVSGSPFHERAGQSMTSTSRGIVFYGGEDSEQIIYDDVWIFDGKSWTYLSLELPTLAYHAACFDGKDSLIIHGGITNRKDDQPVFLPSNLFYQINLSTGTLSSFELSIDTMPDHIYLHSMYYMHTGMFCLFGGKNEKDEVLDTFYEFSIAQKEMKEITPPYKLHIYGQQVEELYNFLFVTNGKDQTGKDHKFAWLFDMEHKIWFEFKTVLFDSRFTFISQTISSNNVLHFVHKSFSQLMSCYVFKEMQGVDYQTNQEYYNFLLPILNKSIQTFNTNKLKQQENETVKELRQHIIFLARERQLVTDDVINNGLLLQTHNEQLLTLQFRLTSFNSRLETNQNKMKTKINENATEIPFNDPKEIVQKYKLFAIQSKAEKRRLSHEAQQLSDQADRLTMTYLKDSLRELRRQAPPIRKEDSVEEYQQKCLRCRQMAQLISSYRKENAQLKPNYVKLKDSYMRAKASTISLLDQYCIALKQQSISKQNEYESKVKCLQLSQTILKKRIDIMKSNMNKSAQATEEMLEEAKAPLTTENLSKLLTVKAQIKTSIQKNISAFLNQQHDPNHTKQSIEHLLSLIEDIASWMKSCKKAIPEIESGSFQIGSSKSDKFVKKPNTNFIDSLFRCDTLDIEIQRLSNQLKIN